MRLPSNSWSSTKLSEHTKFFAQSVYEQFYSKTWDNYSVPSLDAVSKLIEAHQICVDVAMGRAKKESLTSPIQEIVYSLKNDLIVTNILGHTLDPLIVDLENRSLKTKEIEKILTYLITKIKPIYKLELENSIINNIVELGKEDDLYSLSRDYCSHIVNCGFSRTYIFDCAKEIFFSKSIARSGAGLLRTFFKKFDEDKTNTYKVVFQLDSKLSDIISNNRVKVYEDLSAVSAYLEKKHYNLFPAKKNKVLAVIEVEALDYFKAKERADYMLEFLISLTKLSIHYHSIWRHNKVLVYKKARKNIESWAFRLNPHILGGGRKETDKIIKSKYQEYQEAIFRNLGDDCMMQMIYSLRARLKAIRNISVDSQLLSIWSGMESLLPPQSDASENSIIERLKSSMLPIITNQYFRRKLKAIIQVATADHPDFKKVLTNYKADLTMEEALLMLMFEEENHEFGNKLLESVKNNPLLKWRIVDFRKTFQSRRKISKLYKKHKERVSWQLERVYRSRNHFVHGGRESSQAVGLTRNLDEYYRCIIDCLTRELIGSKYRTTLDQLMMDIKINDKVVEKIILTFPENEPIEEYVKSLINWKAN